MKLYLARHGEAVPKHINPDSPLSEEGRKEVEAVAMFLARGVIRFGQIRHSNKARARQTSEIFAKAMGGGANIEAMKGLNPMDDPEPALEQIMRFSEDILLVGHLPFMGRLVDLILAGSSASGLVEFHTCTVVCLQKRNRSDWTLRWMLSPELFTQDL
ncbi:MAG: phosphohistidine phosphatase SixA [Nitrospinota bacterium]|nr:phosphohistidine phosphatase SixA [Nitrospinota bacterium]